MHDRITIRMTAEMIARIDQWIAKYPGYISRQEAVRRLVDLALDHAINRVGMEEARERLCDTEMAPWLTYERNAESVASKSTI